MKLNRTKTASTALLAGVLALTLAACSSDGGSASTPDANGTTTPSEATEDATEDATEAPVTTLSGNLAGAGASSQENAMGGWIAGFGDMHPDVLVSYDPIGSGGGREQFIAGATLFAGSDSALKPEEVEAATQRCFGGEPLQLPLYISPIAIVYNLPSLDAEHLQLTAETTAKIFNREITQWNDPAIAAENPGVTLPDLDIIPVNRSDESGTTDNFTEWLAAASNGAWPHEPSGDWPLTGGQSGAQTQGMIDVVSGAEGTIGYADASRVGDLGTVAIGVGDSFVPYSAEAAAAVVDASPAAEGASDKQLVVELDRATTADGAYPVVLISYSIACSVYDNQQDVDNVKAFLSYVAGEEGQTRAADPTVAGAAPISAELRTAVDAAIASISVG